MAVDNSTISGSATATTWIHGRGVEVVGGTPLYVMLSTILDTAAVTTAGTDTLYIVRVTILQIM
jgi:hypothetical protein